MNVHGSMETFAGVFNIDSG